MKRLRQRRDDPEEIKRNNEQKQETYGEVVKQ